jgi:2-phospho-L-lactate guanylyltransferase
VRLGPTAKRRLAHVLGPDERSRLVRALFDHVVYVLDNAGLRVVVLSPSKISVPFEVWSDERPGLNAALGSALRRIDAPVLVVHADLPRLETDDVDEIIGSTADVVVARSRDGGTNGLLLRRLIAPAFGPGSALVHAARARASGLRAHVVDTPGFAFDVDDEAALSACGAACVPGTRL